MKGRRSVTVLRLVLIAVLPLCVAAAWLLPASGNECTVPARQQLANPGFEAGTTGWAMRGTGAAASAELPRCGAASARLAPPAGQQAALSQLLSTDPGTEYRLTGYVARDSASAPSASLSAWWITSTGPQLAKSLTAGVQPGWGQLDTGWLTVPAGASYLQVVLAASNPSGGTSGSVYFDDIALVTAPPPTSTPTPSPTPDLTATAAAGAEVYLNELLTRPASDWNADGAVSSGDAWIEVYADPSTEVNLEGWRLDDGPGGQAPVRLEPLNVHRDSFAVLHSSYTGLSLIHAPSLQLLRPDGTLADSVELPTLAPDVSYSRVPDGTGTWSDVWLPTPLSRNGSRGPVATATPTSTPTATSTPVPTATTTPEPTTTPTPEPQPPLLTIRAARAAQPGTPLRVRGYVSAPPGATGARRMYIQDDTGGVLVVIGDGASEPNTGALVEVAGTADAYYGEQAVRPADMGIRGLGSTRPVQTVPVRTGDVGKPVEGLLVQIAGTITSVGKPNIRANDGSGEARVRFPDRLPWPSPRSGDGISAVGIVSSFNGSFRLLPFEPSHVVVTRRQAPPPLVSIRMARALPEGSRARITGSVTAAPGELRAGQMYVQDQSGGILVTGRLPDLPAGSVVSVEGIRSTYHSERRLRALRVSAASGIASPSTLLISPGEVGPLTEGHLVTLSGTVRSSSWPSILVGTPRVRVYAPRAERFENPRARRGDSATVIGIVSQWDGKFRVLLRRPGDLSITHRAGEVFQTVQLDDLRKLPLGTAVSFRATVTAAPGVLGRSRAYVGSPRSGIALHLVSGDYPYLREGDAVLVMGVLDTYQSERIVRLASGSSVRTTGHGALVKPLAASTGSIGPTLEGRLVSVQAGITARRWPSLYLNDGSGEARAVVLDSTGIPVLAGSKHDTARITGLVSRWRERWRLLPRRTSDVRVQTVPKLPRSGGGGMSARASQGARMPESYTARRYPGDVVQDRVQPAEHDQLIRRGALATALRRAGP